MIFVGPQSVRSVSGGDHLEPPPTNVPSPAFPGFPGWVPAFLGTGRSSASTSDVGPIARPRGAGRTADTEARSVDEPEIDGVPIARSGVTEVLQPVHDRTGRRTAVGTLTSVAASP